MSSSLPSYYGMLTFKETRNAKMIQGIPNNNVRKQYINLSYTDAYTMP